jgi:hypothetical protein
MLEVACVSAVLCRVVSAACLVAFALAPRGRVSAAGSASPRAAAARLAAANVFGKPGPHSEGVLRQFLRGRLPAGTSLAPTTLCRDDAAQVRYRDGACWLLNFDARASQGNHWAGAIMSRGHAYFVCSFGTRGPPKAITAAIQACLPPGGCRRCCTSMRVNPFFHRCIKRARVFAIDLLWPTALASAL